MPPMIVRDRTTLKEHTGAMEEVVPATHGVQSELLASIDLGDEIEGMAGYHGTTTDYGPGLGWPEDRNTRHWLENRGDVRAVEVSVDVVAADG